MPLSYAATPQPGRLFFVMNAPSAAEADEVVRQVRRACDEARPKSVTKP